jgi:hypothetical protein
MHLCIYLLLSIYAFIYLFPMAINIANFQTILFIRFFSYKPPFLNFFFIKIWCTEHAVIFNRWVPRKIYFKIIFFFLYAKHWFWFWYFCEFFPCEPINFRYFCFDFPIYNLNDKNFQG